MSRRGNISNIWSAKLPSIVKKMATLWHLSNLKEIESLSESFILEGMRGKQPIVLKLHPDSNGLKHEALLMKLFSDFGALVVLEEIPGALLLERAMPGTSLRTYFPEKDLEAINITSDVMNRLHRAPIPTSHQQIPHIRDWLTALDKSWPIPNEHLIRSRKMRDKLLETAGPDVLLHGDLHHDNMLKNGKYWSIIDPKGVIGESAFESAAFIRNPIPELLTQKEAKDIIRKRIDTFAKFLGFDAKRLLIWSYVQSVLAWIWSLEDGKDPNYFKKLTNTLMALK